MISRKFFLTSMSILFVISAVVITALSFSLKVKMDKYHKLEEIEKIVKSDFYGELDYDNIEEALCEGYIEGLGDKYSYYKNKQDTKDKSLQSAGKTIGIGMYIVCNPDNNGIFVINSMTNSPASKAGIQSGDTVIAISGAAVSEMGYAAAVKKIQSIKDGEKVNLTVLRGAEQFEAKIVAEKFTTQNVYYRMIGKSGYIRILSFDAATYSQFQIALESCIDNGATGLIFDLQGNGGGTFESMTKMLDLLVGKGYLMTLELADGTTKKVCKSGANEVNLPMAVLLNGSSASASELFAATLRDYKKAVIIGEKSYGKCVMQRTYPFDDGTSVRITIAKAKTKSNYDFNGKGLVPDIKVNLTDWQKQRYEMLSDADNPVISAAVGWLRQ